MPKEPRKRIHAPTVSTDPVLEAMARKLSGIQTVPPMVQEKMIKSAAKAGKKAIEAQSRFSYIEITNPKYEGTINLFWDDFPIAWVNEIEIANQIKQVIPKFKAKK